MSVYFIALQMSPHTWAVSVMSFPDISKCTSPPTQLPLAHAWTLASHRVTVSERYVIPICASVEIRTVNLIKLKRKSAICLAMTTRMNSAVDL